MRLVKYFCGGIGRENAVPGTRHQVFLRGWSRPRERRVLHQGPDLEVPFNFVPYLGKSGVKEALHAGGCRRHRVSSEGSEAGD